ncbi:MAG: archease [Anaerolineae bacterium]
MKPFEEIEHTADWAFRAFGRDLKELFGNAALALSSLEGVTEQATTVTREVQVEGIDYESLLVNWLSELLYLQETRGETYHHFAVERITLTALTAHIQGAPLGPLNKFVKAITYHNLRIEQTAEGWAATVVVDV